MTGDIAIALPNDTTPEELPRSGLVQTALWEGIRDGRGTAVELPPR